MSGTVGGGVATSLPPVAFSGKPSRQQRRAIIRDFEARAQAHQKSGAAGQPGGKESILADAGKFPFPKRVLKLFVQAPCDFCKAPASHSDGFGPICYHCAQAIYLPPEVNNANAAN